MTTIDQPPAHIELDRRFHETGPDRDPWASALSGQVARDWGWLVTHHVVALLAEAGSGKTHELQHFPDSVWPRSRRFLMRIEDLCSGTFDEAHDSIAQRTAFFTWLKSDGEGLFLLDAVDEAKLPRSRSSAPLRDALKRLSAAIPDDLHRVRVIVTCRSSEWHATTEQEPLQALTTSLAQARTRPEGESLDDGLLAVTFAPLGKVAIDRLGRAHGADNGFLDALRDSGALDHTITPLDVIHYADAYVSHRDLDGPALPRTQRELASASVERRLAERGVTTARSRLRPDNARRGAQLLSFALAVAQRRELAFPGGGGSGLDAEAILAAADPPWHAAQVRELLSTALFVTAGPGLVRPYRVEVAAMLAAEHLDRLIADGFSEQRAISDFFRSSYGRTVVGRSYSSMLAWLASMRPSILRRMIEFAPEILIEDGDPRALGLEDRVTILERHIAQSDELPFGFYFQRSDLQRFAEADLEPDTVRLFSANPGREARLHLLQLIAEGRYSTAAPVLTQLAGDPFTPTDVRIYAMRALVECGSAADLATCAQTMIAWGAPQFAPGVNRIEREREDDARHRLVRHAYPGAIDGRAALRLLSQIAGKDYTSNAKPLAAAMLLAPAEDLDLLVSGLDRLCFPRGDGDRPHAAPPASGSLPDLFRSLVALLGRAIRERPDLHAALVPVHGRCQRTFQWGRGNGYSQRDRAGELDAIPSQFRLAIVAAYASGAVTGPSHRMLEHILLNAGADASMREEEAPQLLAGYNAADKAGRPVYAEILEIWTRHMRPSIGRRWRRRLKQAARNHPLGPDTDTFGALQWHPVRRSIARFKNFKSEVPWRAEDAWIRFKFAASEWWALNYTVLRDLPHLADGHAVFTIFSLLRDERSDEFVILDSAAARRQRFGAMLVRGAIVHAKRHRPTGRTNEVLVGDTLAFAGWGYSWAEHRQEFLAMPDQDALQALTVALTSPISWPTWASELAVARPQQFHASVLSAIPRVIAEHRAADPAFSPHILLRIAEMEPSLRVIVGSDLIAAAEGNWLPGRAAVQALRRIADADPQALSKLRQLARRRSREAVWEGMVERLPEWLGLWAAIDPEAIRELLRWRAGPLDDDRGRSAMARTLDGLFGREDPDGDRLARLENVLLRELATHIFNTFPPEQDDYREGIRARGAQRRGEEVRGAVLKLLSERTDQVGRRELEAFVAEVVEPRDPHWARIWLAGHARDAAQPVPWTLDSIADYGAVSVRKPTNANELLTAVAQGIRDVELDLDTSEFDQRGLFREASESDVRAFLGRHLDRHHRAQYAITQETETSQAKRTDLRCELRETGGSVAVVEIKLLHRWSWDELLDKLTSQLLTQYLISPRVSHGIYLLIDMGKPPKNETPVGIVDIKGLVERLREIVRTDRRFEGKAVEIMTMRIKVPPAPTRKRKASGKGGPKPANTLTGK